MGRTRKYSTPEEAYAAKLQKARENYKKSREGQERKKWGFINTVITADMVGKTIKQLEAEEAVSVPAPEVDEVLSTPTEDVTAPSPAE